MLSSRENLEVKGQGQDNQGSSLKEEGQQPKPGTSSDKAEESGSGHGPAAEDPDPTMSSSGPSYDRKSLRCYLGAAAKTGIHKGNAGKWSFPFQYILFSTSCINEWNEMVSHVSQ